MKKQFFAALALLTMASCAKENTATEPTVDPTEPVAATFTAASITRVASNAWEESDQIGISMVKTTTTTLADGNYENIPHTVGAAGASGTFSPDDTVIYFPVDGSEVDFYAYYPCSTLDVEKNIAVSVATQSFSEIDIVAAKAEAKTKAAPTVTFADEEAFAHQLSKLTITLKEGAGITSLAGLSTTIKGQPTTAKYNVYTSEISGEGDVDDITAVTATDGSTAAAILLPTAAVAGSSIVFTLDGDDYVWDTSLLALAQGSEHSYEITITKTGIIVSGAKISDWNDGADGTGTAE